MRRMHTNTMSVLNNYTDFIRYCVENQRMPIKEVALILKNNYGIYRGSSESNLYKFCLQNDIHRYDYGSVSQTDVNNVVQEAVAHVGPAYGRKMMTGYLRSRGYRFGERLIRRSLTDATPAYARQRQLGMERQLNPSPYYAEYAGHKLHLDQNEKLIAFGVTHVIAIDGFSSKLMAWSTMPLKNNCQIYDEVYRSACLEYGLFDQIRVDYGREFYLILYQQNNLAHLRSNVSRPAYIQTTSTRNHRVERLWVEINARVNYPLKNALQDMVNNDAIDLEDPVTKYCVSSVASSLSKIGMTAVVNSWNSHSIPGKGVPDILFRNTCHTSPVTQAELPASTVVAANYRADGGTIRDNSIFGYDPLHRYINLFRRRDELFNQNFSDFTGLYDFTVNCNNLPLQNAVLCYIDITESICAQHGI